jgi:hypothetical protein
MNFQTHRHVVVLIPSHRVCDTRNKHPRSVRNQRWWLWWEVHHARLSPRVYHWMYASHVVSSWGRSSVTMFCGAVAQLSTYS